MALEENKYQKDSRKKLEYELEKIQKRAQGQILDYVEVALGDPEKFKPTRAKINRSINEFTRAIKKELERSYTIEYQAISEDIIVVANKSR